MGAVEQMASMPGNELAALGQTFIGLGQTLLASLLVAVATGLVSLAIMAQGTAVLHGETLSLGDGIRRGLRRFWPWLGMSILKGLALGGIMVVAFIPVAILIGIAVAISAAATSGGRAGDLAAVGLGLGIICGYGVAILLILLPWLYLSARWVASVPALVVEERGATASLGRSWSLTRRRTWRCVGYVFLLGLLTFLIVSLPLLVVQQVLIAVLPLSARAFTVGLSQVLSTILGVFWQPLNAAAVLLLYFDLRVRAEDYDLAVRVEALAATAEEEGGPGDKPAPTRPSGPE
jgi:hypothetical protein